MPRASRDQAETNHARIARAAARLYREHGLAGVSVAQVMGEAGMTVGAFHGQFGSKEALAAEACASAFADMQASWGQAIREGDSPSRTLDDLINFYLSPGHRDAPGQGCATTALASDAARAGPGSSLRAAFTCGMKSFVDTIASALSFTLSPAQRRQRALATCATLVGALTIARATAGDPVSEEVLAAAREAVKGLQRR
jgi:TetR/AcrR family transcriptional repressor of nem operon